MTRADGIARTVEGITRSLDYAAQRGVILCLENHYKDGNWQYPEFAQPEDIFLEILDAHRLAALRRAVRPVERDGRRLRSDRVPREGQAPRRDDARLGSLPRRRARRSTTCGSPTAPSATRDKLRHGETGKGLNDYDAIFRILAGVGFAGWISVEDGMNGLDEMARSVEFLKAKRGQYYPEPR